MIYDYLKAQLKPYENNPEMMNKMLRQAHLEIDALDKEFAKVYTYCCGCRTFARVAEAYEGMTDYGPPPERPVLRCGACHSIWKFLD